MNQIAVSVIESCIEYPYLRTRLFSRLDIPDGVAQADRVAEAMLGFAEALLASPTPASTPPSDASAPLTDDLEALSLRVSALDGRWPSPPGSGVWEVVRQLAERVETLESKSDSLASRVSTPDGRWPSPPPGSGVWEVVRQLAERVETLEGVATCSRKGSA